MTTELTTLDLSDDDARFLEDCAVVVDLNRKAAAWKVIETANAIHKAHEYLGPAREGLFAKWAKERCGFCRSNAYNWLQVYKEYGSSIRLDNYQASAVILLSQGNIPQEIRDEAAEMAEAGELVTKKAVKRLVDKRKREPQVIDEPDEDADDSVLDVTSSPAEDPADSAPEADEPEPEPLGPLGKAIDKVRLFIFETTDGQEPFFRMKIADELEDLAKELRA